MKKNLTSIFTLFLIIFSLNGYAGFFPVALPDIQCNLVPSYSDPKFCNEFSDVSICQCHSQINSVLWPVFCPNVHKIYNEMIARYKTVEGGCKFALAKGWSHDLTECVRQWTCYHSGGTYDGKKCAGTGQACESW